MTSAPNPPIPAPPQIAQSLDAAIALHRAGQLEEAGLGYQSILQSRPDHPEANHNLGILALQMRQPEAALPYFLAALDADPSRGQFWLDYIDALLQAGQTEDARQVLTLARRQGLEGDEVDALALRLDAQARPGPQDEAGPAPQEIDVLTSLYNEGRYAEAAALAQDMTARFPGFGFGWMALGMVLNLMGKSADALPPLKIALALMPGDATAHSNLGDALHDLGRLDEAEASYRRALEIAPNNVEALNNLGNLLKARKRLDEAENCFRRAVRTDPDLADAHFNLANTLKERGRLDEAEAAYRRAIQIRPNFAEALSNLGLTLHDQGYLGEAMDCLGEALRIDPDHAKAHSNLGNTLACLGRLDEAEACYRRSLEIAPDNAETYNNLGSALLNRGQLGGALDSYRRALEIKPDYAMAHSNLIFTLDLMPGENMASLYNERLRWDAAHAARFLRQGTHANIADPERRLRIGYVSADFMDHSAPKVWGGMLTRFDRSQFDVFAYSNFKGRDNRFTELFKPGVTGWRNIVGLSDEAAAKAIEEDRIDILVDLSGHTSGNRLLVFARQPAPIQVSAWGYATGTGMRAMNVFFADPVTVPPEDRQYFTEQVRYLPSMLGSFFNEPFPQVNELPALTEGIVTFGSLNRLAKITEETYRAWTKVLLAVPRSRLILKTPELNDAAIREQVAGHFTKAGVSAERIVMQGRTSWFEHVQTYHRIDIALDPFPHGGGVTALEGLAMGVPVVALRWPTMAGRVSASIMTALGLTEWIAETQEQYLDTAISKAAELSPLAGLRQRLRGIFTASIIGDQTAYVRAVEREYRQLWREWCSNAK